VQAVGEDELGDALDERPDGDQVEHDDGGGAGPDEGDDAGQHAGRALQDDRPLLVGRGGGEAGPDADDALGDGEGAEDDDHRQHGGRRPDEQDGAEQQGEGALHGEGGRQVAARLRGDAGQAVEDGRLEGRGGHGGDLLGERTRRVEVRDDDGARRL
jgi:hypothetical protein